MAYEQERANSGIFLNPAAIDAQPPTATVLPTPTPEPTPQEGTIQERNGQEQVYTDGAWHAITSL